jgi:hypothetical protein
MRGDSLSRNRQPAHEAGFFTSVDGAAIAGCAQRLATIPVRFPVCRRGALLPMLAIKNIRLTTANFGA